jgi:hypothetical protein
MPNPEALDPSQDDPVYLNCRREAIFILALWACCFVYTVGFCYLTGYASHEPTPQSTGPALGAMVGSLHDFDRTPESLRSPLGLGIPDWVFYGVVMPWLTCIVLTFLFCLFVFKEDDLGPELEDATASDSEASDSTAGDAGS